MQTLSFLGHLKLSLTFNSSQLTTQSEVTKCVLQCLQPIHVYKTPKLHLARTLIIMKHDHKDSEEETIPVAHRRQIARAFMTVAHGYTLITNTKSV